MPEPPFECSQGFCEGERYPLERAAKRRVADARRKGLPSLLVRCPGCKVASPYALEGTKPEVATDVVASPVAKCDGRAVALPELAKAREELWGCGECGTVWSSVPGPQTEDLADLGVRPPPEARRGEAKGRHPGGGRRTPDARAMFRARDLTVGDGPCGSEVESAPPT